MTIDESPIVPAHYDGGGNAWYKEPPVEAYDAAGDYLACPLCGGEVAFQQGGDGEDGAYPDSAQCHECGDYYWSEAM